MLRRGLVLMVALLGLRGAHAQHTDSLSTGTLVGMVTDANSGQPLIGANVFAPDVERGTVTDKSGAYRLKLPAGRHTVRFSYLGYRTENIVVHFRHANIRRDVKLHEETFGLDEVEVVGSADRGMLDEHLGSVRIPVEEIERLPAFLGEVDVIKSIQLLPGVQSGTEGSTGLYVRGGGPDQNLVLLDGAPVYNPSHVFGFLSVFNTDALQDVQLIKGGFPARYGGRLSSVVDLDTKIGDLQDYGADGTVSLVFSGLTLEGPLVEDRASFVVSARRTYIDVLARPFLNRRLAEGQDFASYFYDTNAKLAYRLSDRDRMSLSVYLGRDVYSSTFQNVERTVEPVYTERNAAGADWGNATSALTWRHIHSSRWRSTAAMTFSRYRFDVRMGFEHIEASDPPWKATEEITFSSGITDWSGAIDTEFRPKPSHAARFGAEITRHAFNPGVSSLTVHTTGEAGIDSTLTPEAFPFSGLEGFVYLEDDITIGTRWSANLGLHGSLMRVNGVTYTSLQPRVSTRYELRPDLSIESSFGTMRQYLHLLTNTGLNLPTDLWVAATDRIRPQDAWQVAAGAVYHPTGGAFEASMEGYYKRMSHLFEYLPGAGYAVPGQDWQDKVTSGYGSSYGLELFLRKGTGRTTGWIGYTLSWSKRKFDALNFGQTFPYRYDRRHDVSVVLSHRLSDRVDVGATWVYGTGQAVTLATARSADGRLLDPRTITAGADWPTLREFGSRGGYRIAPYHRLDLVLNWNFDGVLFIDSGKSTLAFGAYNVYNRRNPFYLFEGRRKDGSRVYKQASLFPVLPFVSYRFRF